MTNGLSNAFSARSTRCRRGAGVICAVLSLPHLRQCQSTGEPESRKRFASIRLSDVFAGETLRAFQLDNQHIFDDADRQSSVSRALGQRVEVSVFIGVHQRPDNDLMPFPRHASKVHYWPPVNTECAGKTGREQAMKESHRKGVANHPDNESCEGRRKAVGIVIPRCEFCTRNPARFDARRPIRAVRTRPVLRELLEMPFGFGLELGSICACVPRTDLHARGIELRDPEPVTRIQNIIAVLAPTTYRPPPHRRKLFSAAAC